MVLFLLLFLSVFITAAAVGICQAFSSARNGELTIRVILVVYLAVLVSAWSWFYFGYNSESAREERGNAAEARRCNDASMAYIMSQNFVRRQLKAPSTASFPSGASQFSAGIGNCKFVINSYVDSQNSFGVIARSRFTATMEYLPDGDSWRAIALDIQ